jgi:hypothetical protein
MSFHQDVMDGIQAFATVRNAMKQDGRDRYFDWKVEQEQQVEKARRAAAIAAGLDPDTLQPIKRGTQAPPGAPMVTPQGVATTVPQAPASGGSAAPVNPSAIATQPTGQPSFGGQMAQGWNRGGKVAHFEEGGSTGGMSRPISGESLVEQLLRIRAAAAAAEQQPPPQQSQPQPNPIDNAGPLPPRYGGYRFGVNPTPQPPLPTYPWTQTQPPPSISIDLPPTGQTHGGSFDPMAPGAGGGVPPQPQAPGAGAPTPTAKAVERTLPMLVPRAAAIVPQIDQPMPLAGPAGPPVPPTPTAPSTAGGSRPNPPPVDQSRIVQTPSEIALARTPTAGGPMQPGAESAPPPGSTPTGRPGGAPAVGGPSVRALLDALSPIQDQRRTTAFRPDLEGSDPGNIHVVGAGGNVDPDQLAFVQQHKADYNAALVGGAHFAKWLTHQGDGGVHSERGQLALRAGAGALPVPVAQGIVAAWDKGGQLAPYDALTRYMTTMYQYHSARGDVAQANQMAFEVLQRLNMEAAKYASLAVKQLRDGDLMGAAKTTAMAHAWSPDGRQIHISNDGQSMVVVDSISGKAVSQPLRVTPQAILAASMGLMDGSAMWMHLKQRVETAMRDPNQTKKDVDLTNALLKGEVLRGTIEKQKRAAAGGGAASDPAMDKFRQIATGRTNVGAPEIKIGSTETDPGLSLALQDDNT